MHHCCPRVAGDLAFQVQFGQFSEEQRDTIMCVLTAMFCYKHSKVVTGLFKCQCIKRRALIGDTFQIELEFTSVGF